MGFRVQDSQAHGSLGFRDYAFRGLGRVGFMGLFRKWV